MSNTNNRTAYLDWNSSIEASYKLSIKMSTQFTKLEKHISQQSDEDFCKDMIDRLHDCQPLSTLEQKVLAEDVESGNRLRILYHVCRVIARSLHIRATDLDVGNIESFGYHGTDEDMFKVLSDYYGGSGFQTDELNLNTDTPPEDLVEEYLQTR